MTLAQIFKAATNQRPEPWKEREATDALIEQLSDRVRDLMEQNKVYERLNLEHSRKIIWQSAEIAILTSANTWLDAALKKAFPNGAEGEVFDLWNKARIELNKWEAK